MNCTRCAEFRLFSALIKLNHCLLLFGGLNGPGSQPAYLLDGVDTRKPPLLHQVAGQHGPRSSMAVHAVNRHTLTTNKTRLGVNLQHATHTQRYVVC